MSRSHLPCRAIQQLARLSTAVLLITICVGSAVILASRDAQASPQAVQGAQSAPLASAGTLDGQPSQRASEGAQAPGDSQAAGQGEPAAAGDGQPVQADIPPAVQAAASPEPDKGEAAAAPASKQAARPQAEGALPETQAVDGSWFADAAFLGDSRTEGLLLYSGVKAGGGFAHRGLTVQSARTDRVITVKGQAMTAVEGLSQGRYGKVYLMLGINELGWYQNKRYEDNYAQLIDLVKQAQPGAQIYLQTLIPVTAEKSASSYVNNPQVLAYNEIIARLAQEKEVCLVDVWSAFAGEDGALDPEGSVDGVHLTKAYYIRWLDYLKTHTAP